MFSTALASDFNTLINTYGSTVGGNATFTFNGGTQVITVVGIAHTSLTAADVLFFT